MLESVLPLIPLEMSSGEQTDEFIKNSGVDRKFTEVAKEEALREEQLGSRPLTPRGQDPIRRT